MQICIEVYSILIYLFITYLLGALLYFRKKHNGNVDMEDVLFFFLSPLHILLTFLYGIAQRIFYRNRF